MSGFLDRMAARADGAAAEVAPRVPALFESAAVTTEAIGAAAREARPASLRLPPSVPAALPSPSSRQKPSFASARESGVEVGHPSAVAAMASAVSRSPVPAAQVVDSDREPASVRVERAPVSEPTEHRSLPTPATRTTRTTRTSRQSKPTALVVPALPVALAPAALAGGMTESLVAARRGPDVVRVSIGRVDVRAPAPPPRPSAPPIPVPAAKADRVSLHDYLRGQRGAL
jgi:hypothetical protein